MTTTVKKKKPSARELKAIAAEKKFQRELKAKNAKFKKMSPAQKRVAIAEDVLQILGDKRYKITQGTYCEVSLKDNAKKHSVDLQSQFIGGNVENCSVCAMGAVFAAKVRVADGFNAKFSKHISAFDTERPVYYSNESSISGKTIVKQMEGIFDRNTLRAMEYCFEGGFCGGRGASKGERIYGNEKIELFKKFFNKYTEKGKVSKHDIGNWDAQKDADSKLRLRAIMQNIIRNKGEFKIETEKGLSKIEL